MSDEQPLEPRRLTEIQRAEILQLLGAVPETAELHHAYRCHLLVEDRDKEKREEEGVAILDRKTAAALDDVVQDIVVTGGRLAVLAASQANAKHGELGRWNVAVERWFKWAGAIPWLGSERPGTDTHDVLKGALEKVKEAEVLLDQAYASFEDLPETDEDSVATRQWCVIRALTHALYDTLRTLEGCYGIAVTLGADLERKGETP